MFVGRQIWVTLPYLFCWLLS